MRVFSLEQVQIINRWAMNTYFRHYLLYKYTFTREIVLDLNIGGVDLEIKEEEIIVEVFFVKKRPNPM